MVGQERSVVHQETEVDVLETCELCQEPADLDEFGWCMACAEVMADTWEEIREGGEYDAT